MLGCRVLLTRAPRAWTLITRAMLLGSALTTIAPAQRAAPDPTAIARVRAQYTKREVSIPMCDGTKLFTAIYTPRDTTRAVPILLMRTPYSVGPYGETAYRTQLGPFPDIDREGWIFVDQDVRGRYMSEGYHAFMTPHKGPNRRAGEVDEATDSYDTIEWILKNVATTTGASAAGATPPPDSSWPPACSTRTPRTCSPIPRRQ